MIIPRLYGRLGNQCFQIAAAIAHARKMKTTWAIPRATIDPRVWVNYFVYIVKRENICMYSTREWHKELNHTFDPLPNSKDLTIDGYFQSEKYWPTNEEKTDIGNALGFHCNKQDYIAIHIRRGDYLQYQDQFPVLPMDYYNIAIQQMTLSGFYKFKIYTDDIEWCRKQFYHNYYEGSLIEISIISDPLKAMRDMYNAAGFIIANSTFSLFPALLRLDKPVVIAPHIDRWYGPKNKHLNSPDLMPERFLQI